MKVAIVTCLWQRPEITDVVQDYYANYFDDCTLIAAKTEGDPQPVNTAWHYCYAENKPLAQKFNAAFLEARKHSPDIVVLIGSDDLISYSLIEYYKRVYSPNDTYLLGLKDLFYHDIRTRRTIHWHGLPSRYKSMPIGCGRVFSRNILDRMGWMPLGPKAKANMGMDTNSTDYMKALSIRFKSVTMKEAGAVCVDLKSGVSMHSFDKIMNKPTGYGKSELVPYDVLSQYHSQIERCKTVFS